jgi:hypothetical protein
MGAVYILVTCALLTRQLAATPLDWHSSTTPKTSLHWKHQRLPVQGVFESASGRGAASSTAISLAKNKARSVSTMAQLVNAIPRKETARPGSVVMEDYVHQQNLAHYRRLLADVKLATSKDEIRHSMLMRLLAEEEAKELLMPVDGDRNADAQTVSMMATR